MKIPPNLIGFDIDGVVADTGGAFLRLAREIYGINEFSLADITEFEVERCLPIPPGIIDSIFDKLLVDPIEADLAPMPHAVSILTKLAEHAPLTFITARPEKKPIKEWLIHVLGQDTFSKSRLIAMGDHNGKTSYIQEYGLSYFVDDRAQTCLDLEQDGITPLVFDQPWNIGKHNLCTVDSWLTIGELCA